MIGQTANPEFETKLLTAFTERLLAYCAEMRSGPPFDPTRLDVSISVVTVWPVRRDLREQLDTIAKRVLARELTGARLYRIYFGVNAVLLEPRFLIGIEHRLPPASRVTNRPSQPSVLLLSLVYATDHRYVFPVVLTTAWIAIRRGPPTPDARQEISLPDHMNAVPAGPLLELRYWDHSVEVRRTEARPEYAVAVNERWLRRGDQVPLGRDGTITYADASKRSDLSYVLMELQ